MSLVSAQLRRKDTSQPWGFRMKGGAEQGMPLFLESVNPNGMSAKQGLSAGDIIVAICGANMRGNTHLAAKQEILRAGNELDIIVEKGTLTKGDVKAVVAAQPEERVQVVEEETPSLGGPTYKDVAPKTYQVLKEELPQSEAGGAKPTSIFARKKDDRSGYLKAGGSTIQKAFGERP